MDFERAALMVVDMQNVSLPSEFYSVYNMPEVVQNCQKIIEACREAGIPVIYTRQTHRPDGIGAAYMEPKDESGRPYAYVEGSWDWQVIDDLTPKPGEIVINKTRWSAFFHTDAEVMLRGLGIRNIILCGVTTDACLQASVSDAFYNDYPVAVVKDACGAYNRACHEASILDLANWIYGITIYTSDELVKAVKREPHRSTFCERPNMFPYTVENLHQLYAEI